MMGFGATRWSGSARAGPSFRGDWMIAPVFAPAWRLTSAADRHSTRSHSQPRLALHMALMLIDVRSERAGESRLARAFLK
jgi:hypothetical protein